MALTGASIEHETLHFYYRVSLGGYDTRELAEAALGSFSDYGEGAWVLKY